MRYNYIMAFKLIAEQDSVKGDNTYTIRLYFDEDTNTQKNEFSLGEDVLYVFEFEQHNLLEPEKDASVESLVRGFDDWYDQFGPDWRPKAFSLGRGVIIPGYNA